ncbi:MAG: PhoH family protein, partial [Myxococcales bacterium]|nr:PhoH family protein [Myxococcales bacterium]
MSHSSAGSQVIKNFVLDTNVLLHDPGALYAFEDNNVVLPIYVIEEIDKFKRDMNELGRSARGVSRTLDELRAQGNLAKGVDLPEGGSLRVAFTGRSLPTAFSTTSHETDSKIIAVALDVKDSTPETPTILVSKDVNLRIRADALGLVAADYEHDRTELEELYSGWRDFQVESERIDALYREGFVEAPEGALPNQFIQLTDHEHPSHTGVGRVDPTGTKLEPFPKKKERVWGISARNREQSFALNLLLDDRIKLVTLVGKAGTGKTLLAIAAGLRSVIDEGSHARMLVSRPIFPLGRDVGYLPGTIEEKLNPWMQPIFDNLEYI